MAKHTFSDRLRSYAKGFLASATLLFGGMKASAESEETTPPKAPAIEAKTDAKQMGRDLYSSAKNLLKMNEGEKLHIYRDSVNKATIGIGCNIQDFSHIATSLDIPFFKSVTNTTTRLNPLQRSILFKNLPTMSTNDLAKYSISAADSDRLSKETYAYFYDRMVQRFVKPGKAYKSINGKTTETTNVLAGVDFGNVPALLQIATMDTVYQLGETKFKTYRLFETALREGRYDDAFKELDVNCTNATQRLFKDKGSARRAFRKDLLRKTYGLQKEYGAFLKLHPETPATDLVFDLVNHAHNATAGKHYNGVINATERKAAFEIVLPFVLDQFYSKDTPAQRAAHGKELSNFWTTMDDYMTTLEKERAAAQQKAEKKDKPQQKKVETKKSAKKKTPVPVAAIDRSR